MSFNSKLAASGWFLGEVVPAAEGVTYTTTLSRGHTNVFTWVAPRSETFKVYTTSHIDTMLRVYDAQTGVQITYNNDRSPTDSGALVSLYAEAGVAYEIYLTSFSSAESINVEVTIESLIKHITASQMDKALEIPRNIKFVMPPDGHLYKVRLLRVVGHTYMLAWRAQSEGALDLDTFNITIFDDTGLGGYPVPVRPRVVGVDGYWAGGFIGGFETAVTKTEERFSYISMVPDPGASGGVEFSIVWNDGTTTPYPENQALSLIVPVDVPGPTIYTPGPEVMVPIPTGLIQIMGPSRIFVFEGVKPQNADGAANSGLVLFQVDIDSWRHESGFLLGSLRSNVVNPSRSGVVSWFRIVRKGDDPFAASLVVPRMDGTLGAVGSGADWEVVTIDVSPDRLIEIGHIEVAML